MQVPSVALFEGAAYQMFVDALETNGVDDVFEHRWCCLAVSSCTELTQRRLPPLQPTLATRLATALATNRQGDRGAESLRRGKSTDRTVSNERTPAI